MVIDHSGFVAGLRAERDAFHALRKLLESEQACLVRGDVQALLDLTKAKSEKVDQLVALAQDRVRHLEALGFASGQDGMAAWLAAHAGAQREELSQVWQQLIDLAADARSLNDLNGKLITTRLSHNQAALATLQSSVRTQSVYGPDGQSAVITGQRELGRA